MHCERAESCDHGHDHDRESSMKPSHQHDGHMARTSVLRASPGWASEQVTTHPHHDSFVFCFFCFFFFFFSRVCAPLATKENAQPAATLVCGTSLGAMRTRSTWRRERCHSHSTKPDSHCRCRNAEDGSASSHMRRRTCSRASSARVLANECGLFSSCCRARTGPWHEISGLAKLTRRTPAKYVAASLRPLTTNKSEPLEPYPDHLPPDLLSWPRNPSRCSLFGNRCALPSQKPQPGSMRRRPRSMPRRLRTFASTVTQRFCFRASRESRERECEPDQLPCRARLTRT